MSDVDLTRARELAEKAYQHVCDIAEGRTKWTMRIPADENRDSDLVISNALAVMPAMADEIERLQADLSEDLHSAQRCGVNGPPCPGCEIERLRRRVDQLLAITNAHIVAGPGGTKSATDGPELWALNVPCPRCGAPTGVWCFDPAMTWPATIHIHPERRAHYETLGARSGDAVRAQ